MRLLGWLPALTTAALLFAPGVAGAQDAPAKQEIEVGGGGTELFRGLLDHAGIKPITRREWLEMTRFEDVILISLGNHTLRPEFGYGPFDRQRLERISASGSVLIATDSRLVLTSSGLEKEGRFTIDGVRVECGGEHAIHRGEQSCPYVVPIEYDEERAIHRIFKGLRHIATNSPSTITGTGWSGDIRFALARFPQDCLRQGFGEFIPRDANFAVGGEGPDRNTTNDYRLLMLADHSIFINQMLLELKTDNLELTYRVIEFLQGPGKQRKRCAFFYEGQLIDHFDDLRQAYAKQNAPPLPQVNLWAMQDKLTDLGNAIIDRLQTNNAHNSLILGSNPNQSLIVIARFFLLLGTVAACFFLVRSLWRTRKPTDIPPPPNVVGASTGPPGVFDRRQKELLRRDNVLEPVRDLVRDFFTSIGIHGDGRMPKAVIADVVRKPDSLRAAIKDFWKIAFGPPQALTVGRWRELEPFFERLRQAHADGKWRFVSADSTAWSLA